ncbi:helix-turn-helix domain-containing protein [Mycolicibacterium thermoresistibile]
MGAWKNASPPVAPVRGVVGRAVDASVYDLYRWEPSAEAAPFVEHFWAVSWDLRDRPPQPSTVISFPVMHLTHEWGEDGVRHGFSLPATLIHGVVPQVFRITLNERGAVAGARFRPGGFTARFGRDAASYTGRVVRAEHGLSGELSIGTIISDELTAVAEQLDTVIGGHRGAPDTTYVALTRLLDRIREDDRMHRVDQVMEHAPWSVRTTQRIFRRYVGVPVKWVLCRYRLQQAALEIESSPDVDFADLAVRLGWYDQPHFINDFRAMLGCTPAQYADRYRSRT